MIENRSEAAHIAGALEGDETAQRDLYEAYHARAFRLAYLLLQDTLDAEEVVQDTFVYAFRNVEQYDPGRAAFWTWLRVILVSRCRNKRRRKQLPRISLEALVAVGQAPSGTEKESDPAAALDRLDTRRRVWKAIQQVSKGARDALILRYYEGLPYAAIADILGCSSDAARSRVVHGKAQLRKLLTDPEERSLPEGGAARPAEVG